MIHIRYYHGDDLPATELGVSQIRAARADPAGVLWVDLEAPTPEEVTSVLGDAFEYHPLAVAACQSDQPRAQLTDFGGYLFVVAHAHATDGQDPAPQLALFLGNNHVISVHQTEMDAVKQSRLAVERDASLMHMGADRLAAELLRQMAAGHRRHVDTLDDALSELARRFQNGPGPAADEVVGLRVRLTRAQQSASALRHVLASLASDELAPLKAENRLYYVAAHEELSAATDRAAAASGLSDALLQAEQAAATRSLNRTLNRLVPLIVLLTVLVAVFVLGPLFVR